MNEPTSLRDLAQSALDARALSARRLAAQAQERGFELTATTLSAIAAGTYKFRPRAETVRAIAWLAGVPESTAFTAAGMPVPGPPFADELPPGVDNLSPKARRAVIEMLRVLVDAERRDADAPAPVERQDDVALAAMAGTPEHMPDDVTGEETQDSGSDEPA
ncbi:hypothetical protein FA014_02060 [Cellulomonas hominis]|uniref:Uncharacterized protein n=1 Tax=Cellulomonas hominis TaxID=156981 RepID=A0A7Z8NRX3_9CELL|nr:hypothetical protein [Cellulomonas hominis]TKR27164.1 hypothetical protein FA014_02060 [Cellulomonas hominis]